MSRSIAPALVTAADVIERDLDNEAIEAKDRDKNLYYVRWIHGEIYKARADVNAVVHSHSPTVVPFASTRPPLRPLLHNASFLGFGAPIFEIRKKRNFDASDGGKAPARPGLFRALNSAGRGLVCRRDLSKVGAG